MTEMEEVLQGAPATAAVEPRLRAEWLVAASVLCAAAGQLLMKMGSGGALGLHTATLAGLMIYGFGTLLWIQAVSRAEISYLYPLSAMNYPLVALGGNLLLGETVHWERWAGILVMTAGIALLTRTAKAAQP